MLFVAMPQQADVDFDRFWQSYPRRQGKKDARKAWGQLKPSAELVTAMLAALAWQVHQPQWTKDDGQFIPLPASWLRSERWDDEPVSVQQPVSADELRQAKAIKWKAWGGRCLHEGGCEDEMTCLQLIAEQRRTVSA